MEDLRALVNVVSQQKVKQIEIISEQAKLSSKAKLLYEGLRSGEIKTDEEAMQILYQQSKVDSKYRKLKSRLRNRLINTLFFIDVQQFGRFEYDRAQIRAFNLFSASKILRYKGMLTAAISLAEQAFKITEKFDFTDLSLALSLELSNYYGVFNYNAKKDSLYKSKVEYYQKLLNLEVSAKNCFNFFAQFINLQKTNLQVNIPESVKQDMLEVENNLNNYTSFEFRIKSYNALYFKSYLNNDYIELERISRSAVEFFKTKKGFSKVGEFVFTQKLGIAYQSLGKFDQAIKTYNEALDHNPTEGRIPWFNIHSHLFNSYLAIKEYQTAFYYLYKATTHSGFNTLPVTYNEPWLVKEAYIHLLIKMNKVVEEGENKLRPFRINRFLNEVPHFSKDKRGLNVSILIIHVLFLFINKKEFEIEDRLNALGQYSFRYLRNDETLRSNAFIKMLQRLPQAGFHPVRLERYVKKYHQRLIETPMNISEQSAEIEIIPYEHLWEIVIELLQMRLDKKI